ncbi:hypothetical protein E0L93_09595 [Rubrobacter taiwanensis]|uniref:Uncharacterized protein n=1 Tax=Rubrobacter taiwanensis TaxID=185139 RepID=A0A4R1BIA7_9ACTN|nr:hypothetical protein [Rubrobacter taiwanensis]TCJ16937.1 hypothetical protein E0L93_09595 [Rubrobacter taiwanensis]
MGLLRTILTLIALVVLAHVALVFLGFGPENHEVVAAVFGLGELFEAPIQLVLPDRGFYVTALAAAAAYLILAFLLGVLES